MQNKEMEGLGLEPQSSRAQPQHAPTTPLKDNTLEIETLSPVFFCAPELKEQTSNADSWDKRERFRRIYNDHERFSWKKKFILSL